MAATQDLDRVLARVRLFPVRHHSPRAAATLSDWLDEVAPELVLVEGPSDATELVPILTDPETEPPVAILGYRTDGTPGSAMWPFASYSPEYRALAWAAQRGVESAFIDLPVGHVLAIDLADGALVDEDGASAAIDPEVAAGGSSEEAGGAPHESDPFAFHRAIASSRGDRSFEEFWEATFEAPAHAPSDFRAALLAYAELVREHVPIRDRDRTRDAWMAGRIAAAIDAGHAPERIAVVVGAAHAVTFAAGDLEPERLDALPTPHPSAVTLIPFSYPRLAEQTGYGAGNRAPQYYQRAHDAGCDFRRAGLEVLIEMTEALRLRGFAVSLADTIEAYRLAVTLAGLRAKSEPGLDELREAAVATLGRGNAAQIAPFLGAAAFGRRIGRVATRLGRNSLQEEFWREVRERRLPSADSPEAFVLKLVNDVEVGTSVFLHRLRVGGIPYAAFRGARAAQGGRSAPAEEAPGGLAALSRMRESWEAQWTPATDAALVEKIVLGNTLVDVVERTLEGHLDGVGSTGAAANVLLEAVVTSAPRAAARGLAACDAFAVGDHDVPSLARAASALSGLVSYGTSRARSSLGDAAIEPLLVKVFERAVLRAPGACVGDDDAVVAVRAALRTLHDVALAQPAVDRDGWLAAAREIVERHDLHSSASGLACGLLFLAQRIDEAEVARVVGLRVGNAVAPAAVASFLEGFFEVNAAVLVQSRDVVEALDRFLTSLDADTFRGALPPLRRAFAALGATERRYLLENVVALRSLHDRAAEVRAIVGEKEKERLAEMSSDLAAALDDLDDLL